MGFAKTKYANMSDDWPDVQFFFASYADSTDGGLFGKKAVGLTDEFYTSVYEEIIYKEAFNVITLLMRPESKGYLKLKDKNPTSKVLIYPNYFEDPIDLKIMVSIRKKSKKLILSIGNALKLQMYVPFFVLRLNI